MSEITVARGLRELKSLKDRIEKAVNGVVLVTIKVGKKLNGNTTQDEFSAKAKAMWQQVNDLIKQHKKLKDAIVLSNAVTKVMVGAKEMTVAEAIEKKTSIVHLKALTDKLRQNFASCDREIERINDANQLRLDKQIEAMLGKEAKRDTAEYQNLVSAFKENNEATLIDPLGISKKIEELEDEIREFEDNVDIALSEKNAVTKITV